LDAVVVGISRDSLESHKNFAAKLSLPYSLLVDDDLELHQAFGVLKEVQQDGEIKKKTIRSTFIIDREGTVIKEFRDVKPEGHAQETADFLKEYDAQH
jgi:thioredoxin-dependent peroxiredoxin